MLITITRMELSHVKEVSVIEEKVFSEPWSQKSFEDAVKSSDYIYLIALDMDRVVGYAGCVVAGDEADVTNIAVDMEYRQRGIGEELLKQLIQQLTLNHVKRVFLEVRESNGSARALYEKTGFKEVGIRKNFYRKPDENGIVMAYEMPQ